MLKTSQKFNKIINSLENIKRAIRNEISLLEEETINEENVQNWILLKKYEIEIEKTKEEVRKVKENDSNSKQEQSK